MKTDTSLAPIAPVAAPPAHGAMPLRTAWNAVIGIPSAILTVLRATRKRASGAERTNRDAAPCDVERRLIELEAHKLAAMHLGPFPY
jgi:hypothetical protein